MCRAGSGSPSRQNLVCQVVSGLFDRCAQSGVIRQRIAGDEDSTGWDVDLDRCDTSQLGDFGPDGARTVVAGHSGHFESAGFHDCE